jgi:hypothetical protein
LEYIFVRTGLKPRFNSHSLIRPRVKPDHKLNSLP